MSSITFRRHNAHLEPSLGGTGHSFAASSSWLNFCLKVSKDAASLIPNLFAHSLAPIVPSCCAMCAVTAFGGAQVVLAARVRSLAVCALLRAQRRRVAARGSARGASAEIAS